MDLSELKPAGSHAPTKVRSEAAASERDDVWGLAAQIGIETAEPLTAALERVRELQSTGKIDRHGLHSLHNELLQARRASIVGQQITRLAQGGIQQQHETLSLTNVLRDVLAQREQDLAARGIAVKQVLKPAEVLVDASLLSALLHAALDWSLRHARTPVDFQLDMKTWPAHARVVCRFGHVPADQIAADASRTMGKPPLTQHLEALDCLSWRLLEQLGHTMQLPMQRIDTAGDTTVTIEFPQTASGSLAGASAKQADRGVVLSGDSRPLAGNQVLVIASRRDIGNQIRHAVAHMGLVLEFVDGVGAARTACQHGLPHAIIYEAASRDRGLDQLRADISHQQGDLAWIEITEHGEAFEVSSFGGMSMARVGRDAIATSLPSALMFELAKGL